MAEIIRKGMYVYPPHFVGLVENTHSEKHGVGVPLKLTENGKGITLNEDVALERARVRWEKFLDDPMVDDTLTLIRHERGMFYPTVIRCACGYELSCDGFTNTCECGRDYDDQGHVLAPRHMWGEDTGETSGDILRAGELD